MPILVQLNPNQILIDSTSFSIIILGGKKVIGGGVKIFHDDWFCVFFLMRRKWSFPPDYDTNMHAEIARQRDKNGDWVLALELKNHQFVMYKSMIFRELVLYQ